VQIHELQPEHVSATRLAWKIARALRARSAWVLKGASASRRWRLRIGSRRWSANVFTSFFFDDAAERGPSVVFAIFFETKHGVGGDLEVTDFFRELRARVGARYVFGRSSPEKMELVWVLRNETNPRVSLEELARLAAIIGGKRERAPLPAKRARALDARLWIVADALLRDGRWAVGTPSMWFVPPVRRPLYLSGFLGPIPRATPKRPIIHTLLLLSAPRSFRRVQRIFAALKRRALARGYEDKDPRHGPVLSKTQPLSIHRALSEADFLESELQRLAPDS